MALISASSVSSSALDSDLAGEQNEQLLPGRVGSAQDVALFEAHGLAGAENGLHLRWSQASEERDLVDNLNQTLSSVFAHDLSCWQRDAEWLLPVMVKVVGWDRQLNSYYCLAS